MSKKYRPYWIDIKDFHLDAVKNELALWHLLEEMTSIEKELRRHQKQSNNSSSDSSNA